MAAGTTAMILIFHNELMWSKDEALTRVATEAEAEISLPFLT